MKDILREHEQQLESIIQHYGEEHQKAKADEEMEELRAALCAEKGEDVAEEIADVYIMLAQMMLIYEIPLYLIVSLVKYKLDRTIYRITQEEKAVDKAKVMAALHADEPESISIIPHLTEESMKGNVYDTDGTKKIRIDFAAPSTQEEKTNDTDKEL